MNKFNLESLVTESVNLDTLNIDKLSTMDILKTINNEDKKVASAVEKEIPKIEMAIEKITEAFKNNGRLIYIGAGTSGRLGVLDAVECFPTYGVSEDMIQGIMAGGKDAMFKAKGYTCWNSCQWKNTICNWCNGTGKTNWGFCDIDYKQFWF